MLQLTPERFLKIGDIAELLLVTTRTLRRWIKAGIFPPPVALTGRVKRWRRGDVEHWIASHK